MSGQIVIRSSTTTTTSTKITRRKQEPTRNPKGRHKKTSSNVGEVAGGTTADICVVCCCCPCVLFEFLILAVYKLPVSVVRRMWRNQRHKVFVNKRKNKGILHHAKGVQHNSHCQHPSQQVVGYIDELSDVDLKEFEKVKVSIDGSAEAIELDKQMWDRFRDAGFWRSPSQGFE